MIRRCVATIIIASIGCAGANISQMPKFCQANVVGVGTVAVETDYLPRVLGCENNAASYEALKAQAVAARSYLYYRLLESGNIHDGTTDQVYRCDRPPTEEHRRAVAETARQALVYQGVQVAAFYVAGSLQLPPSCTAGTKDAYKTERFVTYNEGLSGEMVKQTSLGLIHTNNFANRGCMSQNGSNCLSDLGWDYESILQFYYGEDIQLTTMAGSCDDLR